MKMALLLATTLFLSNSQAITGNEALENLSQRTKSLRDTKFVNDRYWFAAVPLVIIGSSLGEENIKKFATLTAASLIGKTGLNIIEWIKGMNARWCFRYLYNKKINSSGYLVDGFGTGDFVLNDQQFVAFGFKCGFYTFELIDLAKKAGRTSLAAQLAATEYYA